MKIIITFNRRFTRVFRVQVNIIFHGAATINFEETIKIAALTNIRGTREILNLAKSCKQLKLVTKILMLFIIIKYRKSITALRN